MRWFQVNHDSSHLNCLKFLKTMKATIRGVGLVQNAWLPANPNQAPFAIPKINKMALFIMYTGKKLLFWEKKKIENHNLSRLLGLLFLSAFSDFVCYNWRSFNNIYHFSQKKKKNSPASMSGKIVIIKWNSECNNYCSFRQSQWTSNI